MNPKADIISSPPSNEVFSSLLKKYVTDMGFVDYKGFISERNIFEEYLNSLSSTPPDRSWNKNEQIAYWINAYNAFTIKLIIDHYPLKSIKDIGPYIQIPRVNTPWQKKFIQIGNKTYNLDKIEHSILRSKFNDPRIHFALVCASISCPKLRREAYEASKLDDQLNEQGKHFLANQNKNIIEADKLKLSKYFTWYKGDFTQDGSLIDYLNIFAPVKINSQAEIDYLEYNWGLNEQ